MFLLFLTVRLYDVGTLQCFVSSDARDQHLDSVTAVNYSMDGRLYTSASVDGTIKVSQWHSHAKYCGIAC